MPTKGKPLWAKTANGKGEELYPLESVKGQRGLWTVRRPSGHVTYVKSPNSSLSEYKDPTVVYINQPRVNRNRARLPIRKR